MKHTAPQKSEQDNIPRAEWIVATMGLILLCGCMAFLLYKAFMVEDGDPKISFQIKQIVPQDGGALVLTKVSNHGGKTVSGLHVQGSSGSESHEVEIDFLPARSSRNFGMFFRVKPAPGSVEFTPGGYQEP